MKIATLIEKYGIENMSNAVVLPVGGDADTGSRSYWVAGSLLDLSNPEDTDSEIITELPGLVFIANDSSVWKINNMGKK
jgi:hypothetical protein